MDLDILYEDDTLLVIDKPVGVVSNRAETVTSETLQDYMAKRYKFVLENSYFAERKGLVHRLDKDTSGVMVLAKTAQAFEELLRQFKEREIRKTYLALTHGIWAVKEGTIKLPIGRMRHNRKQMGVRAEGRESETAYRVLREYHDWNFPRELGVQAKGYTGFSMVEFVPRTGRMHQLRVHAKHNRHPIVGDVIYAGRKRVREDQKWAGRLMLQAQKLSFTHPGTTKPVTFIAKDELSQIAKKYLRE